MKEGDKPKGFGYVEFSTLDQLKVAISKSGQVCHCVTTLSLSLIQKIVLTEYTRNWEVEFSGYLLLKALNNALVALIPGRVAIIGGWTLTGLEQVHFLRLVIITDGQVSVTAIVARDRLWKVILTGLAQVLCQP